MAVTEIRLLGQTVSVGPISRVIATEVELDEEAGLYVREIRVFEAPTDEPGANEVLVFTLRVTGLTRESVEMTVPASQF